MDVLGWISSMAAIYLSVWDGWGPWTMLLMLVIIYYYHSL
jgi:hypothetical protein